ncbi:hypothetical protein Lalb_Chr04g0250831 [Lupinus albus]|uniref:Uncharacterized protein n=1 Tax=Lupinus albus TaxID=3870 RepID=A0A6A4QLB0_LUPAL|nr:hypothetical protein Lalb_Chr04g0250831 [Lupinus albus]
MCGHVLMLNQPDSSVPLLYEWLYRPYCYTQEHHIICGGPDSIVLQKHMLLWTLIRIQGSESCSL